MHDYTRHSRAVSAHSPLAHSINTLEEAVLALFNGLLDHDPVCEQRVGAVRELLKDADPDAVCRIEAGESPGFVFTLQALFECLPPLTELSYKQFRQLLFQTRVNQRLMSQGAKIAIQDNFGNVNQTVYRLAYARVAEPA